MSRLITYIQGIGLTALLGLLVAFLATPLPLETQALVGWGGLGALLLVGVLRVRKFNRVLLYTIVIVVAGRYMVWRLTYTVPTEGTWVAIVPGVLLVAAELYAFWMLLASMFMLLDPIRRPVVTIGERPDTTLPSVDVFIPTYDESVDIIEPTLLAVANLRYPPDRLHLYLLDDGGTEQCLARDDDGSAAERAAQLKTLCEGLGIEYLTRARNNNAKAGNLHHALSHSQGDLIAVFDCDHMPTEDFLEKTVPHCMDNEQVWLVQTPHAFLTPDPIERNLRIAEVMPDENEMFYSAIQHGLDRWNATFFCGSAALMRRAAIESAGGFRGDTVTEDAETALDMHARGWESVYVSEPLIAGLQPETLSAYLGQRGRWLKGMIQIFLWRNPLFKRGLRMPQRICYLAIQTYWLFPLARVIFLLAPVYFLLTQQVFYLATPQEFLAYTLPFLLTVLFYSNIIFGRVRRPLMSDLYETALSPQMLVVLLETLIRPKRAQFNVTAKGETLAQDYLSPRALPMIGLLTLTLGAMMLGGWHFYSEPQGRGAIVVVMGFATLNLILMLGALHSMVERAQVGLTRRLVVDKPIRCHLAETTEMPMQRGQLAEITPDGQATLHYPLTTPPDPGSIIEFAEVNQANWIRGRIVGCERLAEVVAVHIQRLHDDQATRQAWLSLMLDSNHALQARFTRRHYRQFTLSGLLRLIRLALMAPVRLWQVPRKKHLHGRRPTPPHSASSAHAVEPEEA